MPFGSTGFADHMVMKRGAIEHIGKAGKFIQQAIALEQ